MPGGRRGEHQLSHCQVAPRSEKSPEKVDMALLLWALRHSGVGNAVGQLATGSNVQTPLTKAVAKGQERRHVWGWRPGRQLPWNHTVRAESIYVGFN